MTRKVAVVVTARASYARIKSVLSKVAATEGLELQLIVAASALLDRYGEAIRYIEEDGFEVAARVYMVLEGENLVSMAKSTGLGLVEFSTTFENLKPDVVVTVADRYETLATAIAASYMNIPVAHVQGGEVTGSIDEKVRHAVTKLSDQHYVSTVSAAERVIRMGEIPSSVHMTGCPSVDLAAEIAETPIHDFDPFEKYGGVGKTFDLRDEYLVVLQHPVTTVHELSRSHVEETLSAIQNLGYPAFWFWPNVDAGSDGTSRGIRAFRETNSPENIHFFKNMSPEDFLRLANGSRCVVGNSSVAIRECSFLGVPAVNIGGRQNGRERGKNVRDVDFDCGAIETAVKEQMAHGRFERETIYGDGLAAPRIAKLLEESELRSEKQLTY